MAVRMVAFDMDGTMLTSERLPPKGVGAEIRRLHEQGVTCVAATGRFYGTVRSMFPDCADCISCVGCNGHEIYHDGECLSLLSFDEGTVDLVVEQAKSCPGVIPVLFSSSGGAALVDRASWPELGEREYGPVRTLPEADFSEPIIKISLFAPEGRDGVDEYMNGLSGRLPQDVRWVPTSAWTVDACLDGMNKARGIRVLADALGVDMADVMAFGDHMNDMEMLQAVGEGVAMGNALPEVKAVANRVTWTNDEFGVLRELRRL